MSATPLVDLIGETCAYCEEDFKVGEHVTAVLQGMDVRPYTAYDRDIEEVSLCADMDWKQQSLYHDQCYLLSIGMDEEDTDDILPIGE